MSFIPVDHHNQTEHEMFGERRVTLMEGTPQGDTEREKACLGVTHKAPGGLDLAMLMDQE